MKPLTLGHGTCALEAPGAHGAVLTSYYTASELTKIVPLTVALHAEAKAIIIPSTSVGDP